jgi:putative ABC transport system permease protein
VSGLGLDLRLALRTLSRSPRFVALMLLTLALGIGVNAAIFSVADAVLLEPLPYPQEERILCISGRTPQSFVRFTPSGFELWPSELGESRVFSAVGVYETGGLNLGGEPAERLNAAAVTPAFFPALGAPPAAGHLFTAEEVAHTPSLAVISHRLWHARFGGERSIVGNSVLLNGRSFSIVGVMPPRVDFPGGADVWVPAAEDVQVGTSIPAPGVLARLAQGATPTQARDVFQSLDRGRGGGRVGVQPLHESLVGDVRPMLLLVWAAAALLLLVTSSNAACLLLARVAAREREFAVRRALGAGRGRLVRQVFCEGLLLSIGGGLAALLGASWTLGLVRGLVPATVHGSADVALNGRAILALGALSISTALVFGVAPAVSIPGRVSSVVLQAASGGTCDFFWRRFRSALVIGEMAIALVLLAGAAAIVRTMAALTSIDLGARGERALTLDVAPPLAVYSSPDQVVRLWRALGAELRPIHVVEAVGATDRLPGSTLGPILATELKTLVPGGRARGRCADLLFATPGYFAALGIDLLAGRAFDDDDGPSAPAVAVVSEGSARALGLGPAEIIGRRIDLGGMMEGARWAEVVGVVHDVRMGGPSQPLDRAVYVPLAQSRDPVGGALHVVVKTRDDPRRLVPTLRAAVARVDPNLPLYDIRTFDDIRKSALADSRFAMTMMLAFGVLTFGLAAVGLFGVIAYLVELRRREIGIRVAVGASPQRVLGEVLATGLRHAGAGVVAGVAFALALDGLFRVPELGRIDAASLAAPALAVLTAGLTAAWLPALRATQVDPVQVLRAE